MDIRIQNKRRITGVILTGGLLLGVLLKTASADIFEKPENVYSLDGAMAEDQSGFYYRGGVDYRPAIPTEDPLSGFSMVSGSLGCSGFDFASSFKSAFNELAFTDYLKGISAEAMAAAPMVLLQYVSPTLADIIKNFNAMTNQRLGMRYQQCEDIERAAGDYTDTLRKKSESECIKAKQKDGADLETAMTQCRGQEDPFAFLKDANNVPLANGGSINVIEDIFKKIGIPQLRIDFGKKVTGETKITKNDVEKDKGKESIGETYDKYREETLNKLLELIAKYKNNPNLLGLGDKRDNAPGNSGAPGDSPPGGSNAPGGTLTELSLPNYPVTEGQFRNIIVLPEAKQYIASAKLASNIAYYKTIENYRQLMADFLEAMTAPGVDELQKEVLKYNYESTKEKLERFKEQRNIYKEQNEQMISILTEAERERLDAINNNDGTTTYFVGEADELEKKENYLQEDDGETEK